MKIFVIGATGRTGLRVLEEARTRGHSVTALVRRSSIEGWPPGVRTVVGDVLDTAALSEAMRCHDVVISAVGPRGTDFRPQDLRRRAAASIVAAMEQARISRLVAVSILGANESHAAMGAFFRHVVARILRHPIEDAGHMEDILRASSVRWTLARPPRLTEAKPTGRYRVHRDPSRAKYSISRGDLARFLVDAVETERYAGQAPALST